MDINQQTSNLPLSKPHVSTPADTNRFFRSTCGLYGALVGLGDVPVAQAASKFATVGSGASIAMALTKFAAKLATNQNLKLIVFRSFVRVW
jgi:hypothetical protein